MPVEALPAVASPKWEDHSDGEHGDVFYKQIFTLKVGIPAYVLSIMYTLAAAAAAAAQGEKCSSATELLKSTESLKQLCIHGGTFYAYVLTNSQTFDAAVYTTCHPDRVDGNPVPRLRPRHHLRRDPVHEGRPGLQRGSDRNCDRCP